MYCLTGVFFYYKCSVAHPHGAVVGLQCVIVVFPDPTHLLFVYIHIGHPYEHNP